MPALLAAPVYSEALLSAAGPLARPPAEEPAAGLFLLRGRTESGSAGGGPLTALWDTGAEGDFAALHCVERLGLTGLLRPSSRRVKYADGSVRPALGELDLPLRLLTLGRSYHATVRVVVADLQQRFDIVLGTPFGRNHQPRMDWQAMTILLPEQRPNGPGPWRAILRAPARPEGGRQLPRADSEPNGWLAGERLTQA